MALTIFFSVGEPSGDLHGANLIRELRERQPNTRCVGYGGPQMASAGCELHSDLTKLAVMWIAKVIVNFHRFLGLLFQADRYFRDKRPDAVVLIDYPGFNWWIARRAKARGIPVFYYGTPQLWAWAPWRVKKMQRFVDHVLCKLPFEPDWFAARGCHATYVGHPYFDELATRQLDSGFVNDTKQSADAIVTLLPGSRNQEVALHLPQFLKTVGHIQADPQSNGTDRKVHFAIASYSAAHAVTARAMLAAAKLPNPDAVSVHVHRTAELIEAATVCLACSGSVSLELLYHAKPSIILYQVSRLGYWLQNRFRIARYITLVNLLATDNIERDPAAEYDPDDATSESVPLPEYLTCEDRTTDMARRVVRLLDNPSEREVVRSRLIRLREKFGSGGASKRAAAYMLEVLHGDPSAKDVKGVSHNVVPAPKMLQRRDQATTDNRRNSA